ncbi:hypothetical protein HDU98_009512 [Podochytrium sp. JEL0797]|nr:hypothetical protein HDU98_009512 [Podochytrium sp. JEL0797]
MSATPSETNLGEDSPSSAANTTSSIIFGVGSSASESLLPLTTADAARTRTAGMTQSEVLTSIANRILHSKFYRGLYVVMMVLSLICLALVSVGPSGLYYWLDAIVNLTMIIEVLIRVNAMGKNFWKSIWNQIDIALVFLCIVTLFWLIFGECQADSANWETELDALLLIVRNAVQLFRVIAMVNKNREQLMGRGTPAAIDFNNAAPNVDYLGGASIDLSRGSSVGIGGNSNGRVAPSVFDFEGEEGDSWGF